MFQGKFLSKDFVSWFLPKIARKLAFLHFQGTFYFNATLYNYKQFIHKIIIRVAHEFVYTTQPWLHKRQNIDGKRLEVKNIHSLYKYPPFACFPLSFHLWCDPADITLIPQSCGSFCRPSICCTELCLYCQLVWFMWSEKQPQ